jgi:hypothetical protein
LNREKPFNDAFADGASATPQSLRRIADALLDKAEQGDLPSAREVIDRLDGKAVQIIDRTDVIVAAELTDAELLVIAAGGRIEDEMKVIPPVPSKG